MREFILGMVFALPVFALILLIFRDIVINHYIDTFISKRIVDMKSDEETRVALLKKDVFEDILISYRLLVALFATIKTILKFKVLGAEETQLLEEHLKNVVSNIKETEHFLDDNGLTENYVMIKKEVLKKEDKKPERVGGVF